MPYLISFGGQRPQITPEDPNDDQGPRLLFSWPPEGAASVQPGKPIILHFSESLAESNFSGPVSGWLTFESHNVINAEPSKDFKEVVIHYSGPASGEVNLSVSSTLVDRNGQGFDQDPDEDGDQSFNLGFELASSVNRSLPEGPVSGGGVVFHGAYAFAIEREGEQDGAVFAYDLSDPASPERVGTLSVPGYPTSLAMLPDYSMQLGSGGGCGTGDYLAVAGGRSEFEGPPKYLWIIDVSDPTSPRRVTGAVITFSDTARVNGMQWSPPFLGLQISEGDITSLQVINVPEMVYGLLTPEAETQGFPGSGGNGVDANRDGDYCDTEAGDLPPIPSNRADQLFGMVVTLSPENPKERILDFAIDADSGVIGVVYRTAAVGGGSGYRTLFAGLEPVDGVTAKVEFGASDFPKRLVFLPGTPVEEESNGETTINFKNLGLVSIAGQENRLALIDLTNPAEPTLIHYIGLPPDSGVPQSLKSRGDGFVVVATGSKLLLLDPTKLLKADGPEGHPAFVGPLASIGSNTKKYVSDTSGVNITSSGGNSRLSVTSPQIQLLSFPDEAGSIDDILALTDVERAALLLKGRESEFLVPVKLASPAQSTNVTAATSYYVFVNAPGGFGDEIPMSLVSLTRSGKLLPKSSNSEMPRFLTDDASYGTLTGATNMNATATGSTGTGAAAGNSSTFETDLIVKRLSGDSKSSVFYNTYLGGPVVLTRRNLESEDVTALNSGPEGKRFLKAGAYLWAGLAPKGYSGSLSITNFTSNVVGEKILPGTSSLYRVARPRNPLILIHGVAGSHLEINADADVSLLNQLRARVFSELWPGYHIFDNLLQNINIPILPSVASYPGYARLLSLEDVDLEGDQEMSVVPSDIIRQIPERYNGFAGSGLRLANVDGLEKVYAPLIDYITDDLGYIEYQHGKFNDSGTLVTKRNGGFDANEMHKLRVAPSIDMAQGTGNENSPGGDNNRQRFDDYIQTQVSKHPDFFVFVYDWRLSNVTSAKKLEEFLKLVELFHPDLEKVDIVAHSMGGLVARRFIMNHPDKVDKLITLGTPFLGAPKTILTLETGQFLDSGIQHAVIISKKSMRELAKFFPGAHQLVPFSKYFELEPDAFVEQGWDYNRSGNAYETFGFETFKSALDTIRFAGVDSTPAQESDSFNTAEVIPTTMDGQPGMAIDQSDWTNDPTDVDYYHIYGIQAAPRTIGKIKATRRIRPSLIDAGYFTYREELEIGYVKGDGTVPLISASRMAAGGGSAGRGGGSNAPKAVRIPLFATDDSSAANKLVDHNGMLANPELHRTVGMILNEEFEAPTSGSSGSSTVVTTVRIINADRGSVRILDTQGASLPARVLATLEVAELTGEGDAPPAQFASLQREQFDDHYGVQIYEVDPFVVADSDGAIPARDDEGDGKSDVVEIVAYGEDFQIEVTQEGTPVSVRVEQEVNGVVERLMIWNEIDGEDLVEGTATGNGLVPMARIGRRMVVGSKNAIVVKTSTDRETLAQLLMKAVPSNEAEGGETVVDGAPVNEGSTEVEIAADNTLEGAPARDTTAESRVVCEAFDRNTKYRFFLESSDGTLAQFGRFYYCDSDPSTATDPLKMTKMPGGSVLDVRDLIGSVSSHSIWVVGEDAAKNIAKSPPLEIPLVYLGWEASSTEVFSGRSLGDYEENDLRGMMVFDGPDRSGVRDDLLEVQITLEPADFDRGKISLILEKGQGRVRLYRDEEKLETIDFADAEWELPDSNFPSTIYVEADGFSSEIDDVVLSLSYSDSESGNDATKTIESKMYLTIPEITFEPINSRVIDGVGELTVDEINPSAVILGEPDQFIIDIKPDGESGIPDSIIKWSSQQNRVVFNDDTGRDAILRGIEVGEDRLIVDIEGFAGFSPSINLRVYEREERVKVFAYVVAESTDGTGGVVDQALILTLLENVNQFFRHVGIRFQLEGEIEYVVPPTAGAWNDLSTLALRNEVRSLNQGTGGIEMYFVNQINGGAATGVNNTSQSVNAGILVGMSRILAAKPNGQSAVDRQVSITSATVAHELGHSCGLKDIYTERNGVLLSAEGPLQKEWISEDWGTQSEEIHYYGQELTHPNLIRRLLMFGVRSDNKRDIPVGSVYGLDRNGTDRNVFVGITDPDGGAEIIRSPEHF